MALTSAQSTAAQLVLAYLGRGTDVATLQSYAANFANGMPTAGQLTTLFASAEAQGVFGATPSLSSVIYKSFELIGRTPTTQQATDWVNYATSKNFSLAQLPWEILKAGLATESGYAANQQVLWARTALAYKYAEDVSANTAAVQALASSATAQANARALISAATDVTTAQAIYNGTGAVTIAGSISGIATQSGQTFTLTTSIDNLTGTSGNDTFNASSVDANATGTTINPGDNINAGAGVDTVAIAASGSTTLTAVQAVTFTGVEKILVSEYNTKGGGNSTVDLSLADASLATVGLSSSDAAGTLEFTGLKKVVDAEMKNGANSLTLTFAGGNTGTADVINLAVSGQSAGTFTADGIETINVNSSLVKSAVTVAGNALATVNVAGDTEVSVDASAATVKTVDASTATGKVTITTGALDLSAMTAVKGGAGTTDVLSTGTTIAAVTGLSKVSGFETLKVTGANSVTLAAAATGVSTFDFTDAADQVLNLNTGYTGATTVKLTGDATNADKVVNSANVELTVVANVADIDAGTTITGGTGNDVLTLTADSGAADLTAVSGVETISVLANATTPASTASITTANATVAATKTLTVDASALTNSSATLNFDGSLEADGSLKVTGGAGADTIKGGDSADTLVGGAGNDAITAGAGNDSIDGGVGNDTITLGANLTSADTINGGDGTDTLSISATVVATAFANVTNVENVQITGNTSVSLSAAVGTGLTFDLTDSNDQVLTLATGYAGATTVKLTGDATNADKIVNSANVELTVVANAADIDANTTITGGTGNDVVNLTADASTATTTAIAGVERITVVASTTTPTNGLTITMGANNTQIASNKTLVVDAAALTNASAALTFTGTDSETDGFLNITGGAGNDTITGGASGFDTITGGAGNDSIALTGLSATNVINGGDGTDTLTITTDITSAAFFNGVTSVEVLKLGNLTDVTLAAPISQTGIVTIDATDSTDNIITFNTGYTGATTVKLTGDSTNADKIVNSANIALTVVGNASDIDAATTITGGTGTDTLKLTADNDGTGATITATTGIERIEVVANTTATHDIVINMGANDTQIAAGKTLTVDASALTNSGATLKLVGTQSETDGYIAVIGGAGADTISGGANADTFTGNGSGDVFITQKHGNKFVFDTITDFGASDTIQFNLTAVAADAAAAALGTKLSLAAAAGFADYLDVAAAGDKDGSAGKDPVAKWFQFGGDTYVVVDNGAATTFNVATDVVIKLTGTIDLSASTVALVDAANTATLAYVAV